MLLLLKKHALWLIVVAVMGIGRFMAMRASKEGSEEVKAAVERAREKYKLKESDP